MTNYLQTAIEAALEHDLARAASGGSGGRAPAPAPAPTPPATPDAAAAANAIVVRDFIKAQARARARATRTVDTSSRFYRRLTDFYLRDYLAAPSAARGVTACETKIGKTFAGPATAGDAWEDGALRFWNRQPIPEFARRMRPALPAELAAATDILSRPNRAALPYIDVPHLIGTANMGTGFDADVAGGGKNISQLMHWGTGVKYSNVPKLDMRELFLAYELWHLEAWDVFGEDPINDLISEEAGRILGTQLRAAAITRANLQAKLNEGFGEARAWVGTLLRPRLAALDAWTVATTQRRANIWYGAQPAMDVWGPDTIHSMLRRGMSVDDVKRSSLVDRIIGIYTLIYEADAYEAARGPIDNGTFIPAMLSGSYDRIFERMAKGQPVISFQIMALGEQDAPVEAPIEALVAPIEGYRYDATGTTCSGGPTPGALALRDELARRFAGRGEIYNCRPVRGGQRLSLHGEGRAVDWYRSASDAAQAAEAQRIIDWLLGTDGQGNAHAVARRMGVQEIIWNRRIWSAGRHAEGWRDYGGTNPHTDHLHIGLNRAGAARQTSYWTAPAQAPSSTPASLSGAPVSLAPSSTPPAPAPVAPGGMPVAPGVVAFTRAADIDAWFRQRTGQDFLDWFHATQANRGAWAGKDVRRDADTRRRFQQFWDGAAANVFGQPSIRLEQFVALQSIFINELGGLMAPVTERMGRPGHPGMAYLFDAIPGVKRSYNVAPNRTALECFNDPDFLAAHGALSPGSRLARTTNRAWGGTSWPAGEPTDMTAAPFIAQADFCRFRGRGMIQTTWRDAYGAIVRWVQAYAGTNAKVVQYRTAWAGQGVERVLSRSSNAEWDDLFQNSDYVIPWAGIRLHSTRAGGYLAIATDAATRGGTGPGSFHAMGRRISGSAAYGDLFKRRCIQILDALAAVPAALAAPPAAPRTQALEAGPPPASELTWPDASAQQLAFKRRVYEIQVARARRTRAFVANVPAAELRPIGASGVQMRRAAADACARMLSAAETALREAKARGEALAQGASPLAPGSGYRSVATQFTNWNRGFARYYDDTRAQRQAAPGGEHGEQAAELTARHIGGILGAPGFSLHNSGLAVDLVTVQGGTRLGASTRQRSPWRASWAWAWLTANAARFDFFQNTAIDEPWHWEYRPPAGTGTTTTVSTPVSTPAGVEFGLPAHMLAGIPAGEYAVPVVPLLAAHHGRGPDLVLRWNAIASLAEGIDVVVHLHGFSSDRELQIERNKLPISGLDFVPPAAPASLHAPAHPAWSGRTRPTLCVLPRGRARPGHPAAYDFPALTAAGGFASLVDAALRAFEARTGASAGSAAPRRIVLTAHSGGGAALDAILQRTAGTPLDPHEVHVFDALYGRPVGLRAWLDRRLRADVARLTAARTSTPGTTAQVADAGSLRVIYTPARPGTNPETGRPWVSTEPGSVEIRSAIRALIPAGQPFTAALEARYRVETSVVGHTLVGYWYGGRLLADAGATVARP